MTATNRHHLWWPKNDYRTRLERAFRGMPCQIVVMDMRAHELLHIYTKAPTKPSRNTMRKTIERHAQKECACYGR